MLRPAALPRSRRRGAARSSDRRDRAQLGEARHRPVRQLRRAGAEISAEICAEIARRTLPAVTSHVLALQYILDLKQSHLTLAVVAALHGGIAEMSLQKFSSNVIEKCLTSGDPEVRRDIRRDLTRDIYAEDLTRGSSRAT